MRETLKAFGAVDILVTVAGIAKRFPAEEFPIDDWQQVMNVNVRGTFLCCKHVAKIFRGKRKRENHRPYHPCVHLQGIRAGMPPMVPAKAP